MASAPGPCHVLVAEDEPDIRELLVMILEDQGCKVTAVGDGQAAVDLLVNDDFKIALLDVTMPILSGLAAAAIIRHDQPGVRIVIHTAMDEGWVRERFRGYDAYLRKPLDAELLIKALSGLIQ